MPYIRFKKNVSVAVDVTIRRSNFRPYANPIADFTRRCGKTKDTAEFRDAESLDSLVTFSSHSVFHDFINDRYDQANRSKCGNLTIDGAFLASFNSDPSSWRGTFSFLIN